MKSPLLTRRQAVALGALAGLPTAVHAQSRTQSWPLGTPQHRDSGVDLLRRWVRAAVGAVLAPVEEIRELAGIRESSSGDFDWKIEMHGPRHSAAELTEGVSRVFVHARRRD